MKQGVAAAAAAAAVGQSTVGKQQTVTRTVSESEMAALIKRQQQLQQQGKVGQVQAQSGLTQVFAQAGMQVQQAAASTTTLVKTASGVRAVTPQQMRQLQLHPQIVAQRKMPGQKVAQLAPVKGGVPTQLIVQQKSLPATVTVQQLQQAMKHVQPAGLQQFAHVSIFVCFLKKKTTVTSLRVKISVFRTLSAR